MSPSKKSDGPRCMRRTHAMGHHGAGSAADPSPTVFAAPVGVPILLDGQYPGDLHVRPGLGGEYLARAIDRALDRLATLTEWLEACTSFADGGHGLTRVALRGEERDA